MMVPVSRVDDPLKLPKNFVESLQTGMILLSQWEQKWVRQVRHLCDLNSGVSVRSRIVCRSDQVKVIDNLYGKQSDKTWSLIRFTLYEKFLIGS